jgi:hypothetical protein
MSAKPKTNPSDVDTIPASFARLLAKSGSVEKAVKCLHRNLNAKRSYFDTASGSWIEQDDAPAQVASAKTLLSYAVGEPIKRQQILSGKMPDAPPNRAQLMDTIDRRIAGLLDRPDLSVAELLAARKALAEAEASEPLPALSEEEAVNRARKIHGLPLMPEAQ